VGQGQVQGLVGALQQPGLPGERIQAVLPNEQGHLRRHLPASGFRRHQKEHHAPRRHPGAAARGGVHLAAGHRRPAPRGVQALRAGNLHLPQARPGGLRRHQNRPDAEVPSLAERIRDERRKRRV